MNIQSKPPTTPDEFLRWNEGREGKREFVRGRVVEMMINVTRDHVKLAARLVIALSRRLDDAAYDVGSSDFAVRTPDGIRYPDVFVDRRTPQSRGDDLAATQPVLLAEVLSPSSYGRDFVEKLTDYQGIETVLYYLVLSHEEPRVWLAERTLAGWQRPIELFGGGEIVPLPELGLELSLSELYAGIRL